MDINPMREQRIAFNGLENVDAPYTLYYDETNNIRRFSERQASALADLNELVDRSNAISEGFTQQILPISDRRNATGFLEGFIDVPAFEMVNPPRE